MRTPGEPPSGGRPATTTLVFLPGAGGRREFWCPVAERLADLGPVWLTGYPGFGDVPVDADVHDLDGLYGWVLERLPAGRWLVIAQSMGGVIGARLAIEHPDRVAALALVATSGGLDLRGTGAADWRPEYRREIDGLPSWFLDDRTDLSERLPTIPAPTIVIGARHDPISPPAVVERLAGLIPGARRLILDIGGHDVAHEHPDLVAGAIRTRLAVGRADQRKARSRAAT